jgi:hypothetical protein
MKPNIQKVLETIITKRVELRLLEEKGKKGSFFKLMSPNYSLGSLGRIPKLLVNNGDTRPEPFWIQNGNHRSFPVIRRSLIPRTWGTSCKRNAENVSGVCPLCTVSPWWLLPGSTGGLLPFLKLFHSTKILTASQC